MDTLTHTQILPELIFTTSRSSGAGGQNVNKVNSKVTLRWNLKNSSLISIEQKELLVQKLSNQLTGEGELIITSQESRSQLQNREEALKKLNLIITKALQKRKKRKASKPSKASIKKRLESKKRQSDKKQMRKKL